MSAAAGNVSAKVQPARPALGTFERWLTLWVGLCILAGIGLGQLLPSVFRTLGALQVARINLPVGLLIWLMIVPMLMRVDFSSIAGVRRHWRGFGIT